MKNNRTSTTTTFLAALLLSLFFCIPAQASSEFMDGKLIISGFVKETAYIRTAMLDREKQYRDTSLDFLQTSVLFEALYTVYNKGETTIRLFGGVKWWWEKAPRIDDNLGRHMAHNDRKDYVHPRHFDDDILTEAYIDIIKGPWQLRIGKQIVIWGQLDMQRVADVVNPLDLRRGTPGVDTWEEVKMGLWMIRGFYQSELPGSLLFEFIFNPGHYRNIELPYEGTHYGSPIHQVNPFGIGFGIYHWQRERWSRDAHNWGWDNWELGFRVRGYTWDIDWTLLYYNARSDGPVANPYRVTPYTLIYIQAGINGRTPDVGEWNGGRVFKFKRYQTIGGTAQTYSEKLFSTVWRLEWFYEIGSPMNKGTDGDSGAVYDWTRRDALGAALQCSKKFTIPWFTENIGTGRMLDISVTYFWEKIFNHDRDLVVGDRNHYYKDSSTDSIILFMQQDLLNQSFVFVFTGNYYLRIGKWMAVPSLTYVFPGIHWRADLAYVAYGGGKRRFRYASRVSSSKDSIILRLRYEF